MHQYRNLCQQKNKLEEMRIIEANNLGAFYRHVNKRIKHRDPVPALIDSSGVTNTSDERKANILNEYFASVGTVDNGSIPRNIETQPRMVIDTVVFDVQNIIAAVRKLEANLSAGPDGLHPLLFRRLQSSIAKPLAILFTQLFSAGVVPEA